MPEMWPFAGGREERLLTEGFASSRPSWYNCRAEHAVRRGLRSPGLAVDRARRFRWSVLVRTEDNSRDGAPSAWSKCARSGDHAQQHKESSHNSTGRSRITHDGMTRRVRWATHSP